MPGPIDGLLFAHAAILQATSDFDAQASSDLDAAGLERLAADVEWFADVNDRHMKGEELGLFPKLAELEPHVADTYLFDHEHERGRIEALATSLKAAAAGDAEALGRARRQAHALKEHMHAHVGKENELVIPLVHEHFPPPAQVEMVQQILSTFPPPKMAEVIPWILNKTDVETGAKYIGAISNAMPPEVFAAARGWINEGVEADKLAALRERAPALEGTT